MATLALPVKPADVSPANLRLAMQRRIMTAAHRLERPITAGRFYAAAMIAEDRHLGTDAWPRGHEDLFLSVVKRCWHAVDEAQRRQQASGYMLDPTRATMEVVH